MKRYDEIPHTADFAARIYGKTLTELFENAAYAMFDMMAGITGKLPLDLATDIEVEAQDKETLLISWLNEVLYLSYIEQVIFTDFKVHLEGETKLQAKLKGTKIEDDPGRISSEIKAATYHDLDIKETKGGYEVTVVFDV